MSSFLCKSKTLLSNWKLGKMHDKRTRTLRFVLQKNHASTLIIAEPSNTSEKTLSSLMPATLSVISAAQKLHPGPITLLCDKAVDTSSLPSAVTSVLHLDSSATAPDKTLCGSLLVAETVSAHIQQAQKLYSFSHIVAPATKFGSNVLPRAAAVLGISPVTDIIEILSQDTFVRPIYAGNALAKVQATQDVKVLSVRTTAFEKAIVDGSPAATVINLMEEKEVPPQQTMTEFVKENVSGSDRPDLATANVVVSGGRGLKSAENFAMLEDLADKLGGAVGASRAAVDAGYAPNDLQVGQTGKCVAPELYIACGISGAIQHLSGMKDSKTIVAINSDRDAPIFQVADYGLVDDLFKAVPELTRQL